MKKSISIVVLACFILLSFASICQNIYSFAGSSSPGYSGDGNSAIGAQLNHPIGICLDLNGNLYIADWYNNRVRKVDVNGIITSFAGTGVAGFSGDGGAATSAQIREPRGIASDNSGNIYIVGDNRVRLVNTSGIISTFAGTGNYGFSGDGGPAINANLGYPEGICIDSFGNAYIADFNNNRVRKINSMGVISTYAGTGASGFNGDGGSALSATMFGPTGVGLDQQGNLLICDYGNHCVRKIDGAGIISTFAGNGGLGGFSGDGGLATNAKLSSPFAIALDATGNILISDYGNNRIRRINTAGIITTIAGGEFPGFAGDSGPAISSLLNGPSGVASDPNLNIFISDGFNNRVREICAGSCLATIKEIQPKLNDIVLFPNPNNGLFKIKTDGMRGGFLTIYNSTGSKVFEQTLNDTLTEINSVGLPTGIYSCTIWHGGVLISSIKFIISK